MKFSKLINRDGSFIAVLWHVTLALYFDMYYGISYKPFDRSLKTASVAVSKSTEHVTLTAFVTDLSHPGLSNCYILCGIDAREGAESLVLICAFI